MSLDTEYLNIERDAARTQGYLDGYAAGQAAQRAADAAVCIKRAKWWGGEDQAELTPDMINKSMEAAACAELIRAAQALPAPGDVA